MPPQPVITIGFSSHRLEILPVIKEEMSRHQAIALEEPPEADFQDFLTGTISAADYLADKDVEFPAFSLRQLELVKELHDANKEIVQVEPYQGKLIQIHELLAAGYPRAEVEPQPDFKDIYAAESAASRALLAFYAKAHTAPFPRVVASVKDFARADAARFRLRDAMRAEALAPLAARFSRLYVEAGYIHLFLVKALARRLDGKVLLRPKFVLAGRSRSALGRPRPLGPGDLLTLHYIFGSRISPEKENVLAARSLIHIQLLTKEELAPGPDPTPHLSDEIRAARLSGQLSLEECAALYPEVRRASPAEAVEIVQRHLTD
ncbi:MAG: hypothetical protein ACUVXF_12775 [Desulfobaccales bacterium]